MLLQSYGIFKNCIYINWGDFINTCKHIVSHKSVLLFWNVGVCKQEVEVACTRRLIVNDRGNKGLRKYANNRDESLKCYFGVLKTK